MPRSPGRTGHAWRQLCARVHAEEHHCWLCHQWVDPTLPARHPRSRSVDHLVQLQHGGQPTNRANARLAHLGCNSARGNRLRTVPTHQCACHHGLPCAPPTAPAAALIVNPDSI